MAASAGTPPGSLRPAHLGVKHAAVKTDPLVRNNVHVSGAGDTALVFAHGFGCDQQMWRMVAPAFEATHKVVLFDFVGSGRADRAAYDPARYGTLEGYATDILEICEALDLRGAVLVGHSVSATSAILAANRAPDRFSRLVLVAPSPRYLNDPPGYTGGFERDDILGLLGMMEKNFAGWAGFLGPLVMGNPDRPALAGELTATFCAADPAITRRFAEVTFLSDHRQDLAKVSVPSLILQCSQDAIAPEVVGEYLHRHLARSTLRRLAATGHCPQLSHPQETVEAIREYLAAPVA